MSLPQLVQDKANHFVYGFAVYFTVKLLTKNKHIALVATIVAAGGKELIWDKLLKKGTVDGFDAVATIFPAVLLYSQDA